MRYNFIGFFCVNRKYGTKSRCKILQQTVCERCSARTVGIKGTQLESFQNQKTRNFSSGSRELNFSEPGESV